MFLIRTIKPRNLLTRVVSVSLFLCLLYVILKKSMLPNGSLSKLPYADIYIPPPKFQWHVNDSISDVHYKNDPANTVHIALSVKGESYFSQVTTMLKSMLYYANRFKFNVDECAKRMEPYHTPMCPLSTKLARTFPIHVHIVCSHYTCLLANSTFSGFKLKDFKWTIYPSESYVQRIQWIPNSHYSGTHSLLKLILHDIFPKEVTRAIFLDTDIIFNYNIMELWEFFNKFNSTHALGMTLESYDTDEKCHEKLADLFKNVGINSGVILLRLDLLRNNDWNVLWHDEVFYLLSKESDLSTGDQTVFWSAVDHNPSIFYQLPCEWNFRVTHYTSTHCCPSIWPDRHPNEEDCISQKSSPGTLARRNLVKLAHLNETPKPGEKNFRDLAYKRGEGMMPDLAYESMKKKFLKVYYQFDDIPQECFQ